MENRKYITGEIRAFDRKTAEETRTIEFVISDETRDRHGTVIPVKSWNLDSYNKNGIVGYQHEVYGGWGDPNPDMILGRGEAFVEEGKLIGRVTFEPAEINPLAEKIFQKVLHGTLKATSVGFREVVRGKWGEGEESVNGKTPTYYFGSVELLEFSIVNIPSNPNALRRTIEEETTARQDKEEIQRLGGQIIAQQAEIEALKSKLEFTEKAMRYYQKSRRG